MVLAEEGVLACGAPVQQLHSRRRARQLAPEPLNSHGFDSQSGEAFIRLPVVCEGVAAIRSGLATIA